MHSANRNAYLGEKVILRHGEVKLRSLMEEGAYRTCTFRRVIFDRSGWGRLIQSVSQWITYIYHRALTLLNCVRAVLPADLTVCCRVLRHSAFAWEKLRIQLRRLLVLMLRQSAGGDETHTFIFYMYLCVSLL